MGNYHDLTKAFGNRQPYKYDTKLSCDGTKILCTRGDWSYNETVKRWARESTDPVVLAEWVEHKGKSYAVVYNRGNKCFATEVLGAWRNKPPSLKYGEIGKPTTQQQVSYRCQMIDSLIYSETITHILIPTTFEGDSLLFKKI